jgi:hypothetical protein
MKTSPSMAAILFSLAFCGCLLSRAAEAAPEPAPDQVAKLIAQLDHDDFAKREEAMAKLVEVGERAMPYLRKALDGEAVSPEAEHRIRYLLGTLSGPEHGVVWRGVLSPGLIPKEKAAVPEGIQPGDVITRIGGQPIGSDTAIKRFRESRFQNAPATIWRQGKILQVNLTMNSETTLCFHRWPDPTRQYEQFGHHGPWDRSVQQALALGTLFSNSQCEPLFKQAYDAGCRDAMVISFWAAHLVKLGKLEEAEKIVMAARAEKLHGHPGGKFLYSELPILHADILRYQGKFDEARKAVTAAEAEARKRGAFQAIPALKYHLLRNVCYDDKPDPTAFLKSTADFPYELLTLKDIACWCQFIAGEGDPARALEFLEYLRPRLRTWEAEDVNHFAGLKRYYEFQDEFAKAFKASPAARRNEVPVLCEFGFWVCNAAPGTFAIVPDMPGFWIPGSLVAHVRYWEFPKDYGAWVPVLHYGCEPSRGGDPLGPIVGFHHTGAYSFASGSGEGRAYPDTLFDRMDWGDTFGDKRVKFSVDEGRTRIWINGRAFRTYYDQGRIPGELRMFLSCSTARVAFQNFVHYAPTNLDVDTKAVENAWFAWQAAGKEDDKAKFKSTAESLIKLLKPFPEAKRGIDYVESVLRNSECLNRPGGWRADPRAILGDPQTQAAGVWEASGDWLVGLDRPDWTRGGNLYSQIPMVLPKDFEITGQAAAEGRLCPHLSLKILWNNNLKLCETRAPTTKPSIAVPWSKPPGDRRTPAQERSAKEFVERVKTEKTFGFCLRKVGKEAVLFVNGVEGPLASYDVPTEFALGQYLCFHQVCPHGLFMLRGVTVRAINPGADLHAPAQVPEVKPVPTKAELKPLYDRVEKIKAEMEKAKDARKKAQ